MVTEAMVMCVVISVNNTICHQVASAHRPSLANRSNVSHIELKSVIRSHSRLGERWRSTFIVGDRYNRVIEGIRQVYPEFALAQKFDLECRFSSYVATPPQR